MMDILIIGAGGAGQCAALEASRHGASVIVYSQSEPTRAQTCMAQSGINSALGGASSVALHVEDTLRSAQGLAQESVVRFVMEEGANVTKWLDTLGMPFSRNASGAIAQRKMGAASEPRTCYSQDYTGLKLLHTLYDTCLKEGITFQTGRLLLELAVQDNICYGALFLNIKEGALEFVAAKSIILASGGYAGLYHGTTTNGNESTGDGLAAALRAGAVLSDLEYVQFHPTSLAHSSVLFSESARGAGGIIINDLGERFVNENMTRDEVSRGLAAQLRKGRKIFLDIRHLGETFIKEQFPQERRMAIIHENVDAIHECIPIKPSAHYSMGGIDVNADLQTSVSRLYAVGECANAKLHGANRLGGNSLLEIVVHGRQAGKHAALHVKDADRVVSYDETYWNRRLLGLYGQSDETVYALRKRLGAVLNERVGIFRDATNLQIAFEEIQALEHVYESLHVNDTFANSTWLVEHLKFGNALQLSKALVLSALNRQESRGAHWREDYPMKQEKALHSLVHLHEGVLCWEAKA